MGVGVRLVNKPLTLRYPPRALLGDYLRAGFGLILVAAVAGQLSSSSVSYYVCLIIGVLCSCLLLQTYYRQRTEIDLDDDGVHRSPFKRTVLWENLNVCKLSYFSTRRDHRQGWMQLVIGSGDNVIKVDSRLERFDELARRAEFAARSRGVTMSRTTVVNFQALQEPSR